MLGPRNFHVDIGYDDAGLLVTVSHLPTKQQRSARPKKGENVSKVQERLHAELVRTFLELEDLCFEVGRCEVDGKIGGFYRVEHLPSKRTKCLDTITSPNQNIQQQVLELLLEELWHDGLLSVKSDA
jgi:hypothetical protein